METGFRGSLRAILLCFLAALVSVLFNFVGGPFTKLARSAAGPMIFWSFFGLLCALFFSPASAPVALLLVPFWFSVGLYHELETRGWAGFWSLAAVIFLSAALGAFVPWGISQWTGVSVYEPLLQGLKAQFESLKTTPSLNVFSQNWDFQLLLQLAPSIFLSLLVVNLAMALSFERGLARLLRFQLNRPAFALRLLDFRVPDIVIWVFIVSVALTLVPNPKYLSMIGWNLLILLLVVYFFQGLAVLEVAFLVFRMGFFLRLAFYLLLVGNLPFVLSGVGIADYWLDFRSRLRLWSNRQRAAKG